MLLDGTSVKTAFHFAMLHNLYLTNKAWVFGTSLCVWLCLTLIGCSEPTVGQQFRDIMGDIEVECRKKGLVAYPRAKHSTDGSCDILNVKSADPLATEEGRFAYSLKLPPPHDEPKVEYRKGMSVETYFKELCERESGEWIFKTVEGVTGVFQGRRDIPPTQSGDSLLVYHLREATEFNRTMEDYLVQPYHGRFDYLERPADESELRKRYVRFYRGEEVPGHYKFGTRKRQQPIRVHYVINKESTDSLKARYGFTWRQVASKDMLENGIVGGETILYDRETKDVLAFRRFFYRYWPRPDSKNSRLANHDFCRPRFADAPYQFIQKVIIPVNPVE